MEWCAGQTTGADGWGHAPLLLHVHRLHMQGMGWLRFQGADLAAGRTFFEPASWYAAVGHLAALLLSMSARASHSVSEG